MHLLAIGACAMPLGCSPGNAKSATAPAAPAPIASSASSSAATPVSDAGLGVRDALMRKDGDDLRVGGYVWTETPPCPPCPNPAACGPCSAPRYILADRPKVGDDDDPGAAVWIEFDRLQTFDPSVRMTVEGHLETRGPDRVFVARSVAVAR